MYTNALTTAPLYVIGAWRVGCAEGKGVGGI